MFRVLTILAPHGESFVNYKQRQLAVRVVRFVRYFSQIFDVLASKLDREDDKKETK